MNKKIFSRIAMVAALSFTMPSCNYLDVTPDEKLTLDDVIKTQDHFLNYLKSCYGGVQKMNYWDTTVYTQSTDEHLNPLLWGTGDGGVACACDMLTGGKDWGAYNKIMPTWADAYDYIGQCHLFEKELSTHSLPENITQHDVDVVLEELNFLKAFYYYRLLENFGPIPILDGYFDMNTPNSEIPGRRHFDYCVDFIVAACDRAIKSDLIPEKWDATWWGRITKPIAAALKSKVTLLAASPLWNGDFPFQNWKNTDLLGGECLDGTSYDEKYGYELVPFPSADQQKARWERAKEAAQEAITIAERAGHSLMKVEDAYNLLSAQENKYFQGRLELIYVPGVTERYKEKMANGTAVGSEEEMFLKRVCLYNYLANSYAAIPGEGSSIAAVAGNMEMIWGTILDPGGGFDNLKRRSRLYPVRCSFYNNAWVNGQGANAPTLYSVEHFWTKNGVLPRHDQAWSGMTIQEAADDATFDAWAMDRAGITTKWRTDITNLCYDREPRFYAYIAFDGGDFGGVKMKNGKFPMIMEMKIGSERDGDSETRTTEKPVGNGYTGGNDGAFTGFYNKKWTKLDQINGANSNASDPDVVDYPMPIFRLSELYLNLAECCAALEDANGVQQALYPIRERALGAEHANIPGNLIMPQNKYNHDDGDGFGLMEWVRNERFIELWDESQRYFDLRRWKMGPERLAAGKRQGMKITVRIQNPAVEIAGLTKDTPEANEYNFRYFNTRTTLEGMPYTWTDRMYLAPIWDDEVYSAPKLVQAPNY